MSFDALRAVALLEGLSDDQLRQLLDAGAEVSFTVGDDLFVEGRPADDWWVLLDGSVSLLRHVGHEETVVGVMQQPGQWAGGFRAWDAHGVYLATGRAAVSGRALKVPAARLGALAQEWFPFGVHLIKGVFQTVRRIETIAREREALVALGTLAAGLAHEINNPASAATRAVDALERSSVQLFTSLRELAEESIEAEQFVELDALRKQIRPRAAETDPIEVADQEDELSQWLVAHDVDRDWLIAPSFAAADIDVAWCERVAELLGPRSLPAGMEWVASSLSMDALLAEVKESTRRVSELVAAVRSYSQLDRASVQQVDLVEGLESTLVMLAHELKNGVSIVRDYATDLPPIEAIAGELNQVWTNLIDNAVDAMAGSGTLRISTRPSDTGVVVEIADTGAGMSEEVLSHAFEPFFTTKDVGKGTGLGLDISRRIIVERHGGDITIESGPGETVVRVHLRLEVPAGR